MSRYFKILEKKVRKPKKIVCVDEALGLYADQCIKMYQPSKEDLEKLKEQGNITVVLKGSTKREPAQAFPIHITRLFKQRTMRLIANKEKAQGLVDAEVSNIAQEEQTRLITEYYKQNPEETILDIEGILKAYYETIPHSVSADTTARHKTSD